MLMRARERADERALDEPVPHSADVLAEQNGAELLQARRGIVKRPDDRLALGYRGGAGCLNTIEALPSGAPARLNAQRQDVAPSRCRTTLRRRVGDASTS